jgi:alanine racemase
MSPRKAVIVVGSHYAGKSKTINKYLKRHLGISRYEHRFRLRGQEGRVLSQSREEATWNGFAKSQSLEEAGHKDITRIVRKYSCYNFLVMAARPSRERGSLLIRLRSRLRRAGYRVDIVKVKKDQLPSHYKSRAAQILTHLSR